MSEPVRRYAYFDMDGTLLPWDTQLMFCNHVLRHARWRVFFLVLLLPLLPLAAVGILRSRTIKRVFCAYLWGARRDALEAWASAFAEEVSRWVWPALRAEIEARKRDGCILVLNTASPAVYAEPIARCLGFDYCVATPLVVEEPMPLIPRIAGPNNKRGAKVDAMRRLDLLPHTLPGAGSWAYTDSKVDLPLLACAQYGVVVHPSRELAINAKQRGWASLFPAPAVTRTRWAWVSLQMLFGLWNPAMGCPDAATHAKPSESPSCRDA